MNGLNEKRIITYPWAFIIIYLVVAFFNYSGGYGIHDRKGRPAGADYICFYAASDMSKNEEADKVYTLENIHQEEKKIAGEKTGLVAWFYPPTFLLLTYPLSSMPYVFSLILWLGLSLLVYIWVTLRVVPRKIVPLLILSYPGTFFNILDGQNGFITASIMGLGLLFLNHNPILAGLFIGLLSYKPHLAALVFVALFAGRYWKALISAIISTAAFIVSSIIVFGYQPWINFINTIPKVSTYIALGNLPWSQMITVFGALRLAGISIKVSSFIQGLFAFLAIALVIWVWRSQVPFAIKVSILTASIFLVTPHGFRYDLPVIGLTIAWYGFYCFENGWKTYEKLILVALWLMAFVNSVTVLAKLQVIPIVIMAFLVVAFRRILQLRPDKKVKYDSDSKDWGSSELNTWLNDSKLSSRNPLC